jgi:hypothetical protein
MNQIQHKQKITNRNNTNYIGSMLSFKEKEKNIPRV